MSSTCKECLETILTTISCNKCSNSCINCLEIQKKKCLEILNVKCPHCKKVFVVPQGTIKELIRLYKIEESERKIAKEFYEEYNYFENKWLD